MQSFAVARIAAALIAFATCLLPLKASAQQQTTFCLEGGLRISVERFEIRDGKFVLYVAGSATPIEYPSNVVKGINVPCSSAGQERPQNQPQQNQTQQMQGREEASPARSTDGGQFGIHGSNTIGERLMPMLIEAYSMKKFGKKPVTKLIGDEAQEIALEASSGPGTVIELLAHGSGTATPGLMSGKAVIGMASRRLNADERQQLEQKFNADVLAPGNEHVLALDGLAVIVNPANPVKELTLDQIARIFAGEITNWREVGGDDRPIDIYRRDNKSGTYDTFKSLVLAPAGGTKREISPQAKAYELSELLSSDVEHDVKGIGFIGLPYIGRNTALAISSSCGIASHPSKFSVKTEEYPLARRLYLYTIGTPANSTARDLLEFALSDDAQATVKEAEFVDQAIDFQDDDAQRNWTNGIGDDPTRGLPSGKSVPGAAVEAFARAMDRAHRTSIAFRFEKGSAQLDNRALQDVARLARYLDAPQQSGKRYLIAGFADATGSWGTNKQLALRRAEAVVDELRQVGVHVPRDSIASFSYLAPVACNNSDAGAAKNRRVEVWIWR